MPNTVVHRSSVRTFLQTSVLFGTRMALSGRTGVKANRATTFGSGRSWGTLVVAVTSGFRG